MDTWKTRMLFSYVGLHYEAVQSRCGASPRTPTASFISMCGDVGLGLGNECHFERLPSEKGIQYADFRINNGNIEKGSAGQGPDDRAG